MVTLPKTDKVLVAYSGGKDSLVTLDLCQKAGIHVEAFMMYLVPGLDYTAFWVEYARKRFGVEVRTYQNWFVSHVLRNGVFGPPQNNVQLVSLRDVVNAARRDSGCVWAGFGYKSNDSLSRRGFLKSWVNGMHESAKYFAPIHDWSDRDVFAWLQRRRINIPTEKVGKRRYFGVTLAAENMEFMRDNFPLDYRRILEVFPYAVAQASRAPIVREKKAQWKNRNNAASGTAGAGAVTEDEHPEISIPADDAFRSEAGGL